MTGDDAPRGNLRPSVVLGVALGTGLVVAALVVFWRKRPSETAPPPPAAATTAPALRRDPSWAPTGDQFEPPPGLDVSPAHPPKPEKLGPTNLWVRSGEVVLEFKPKVGDAEMKAFHAQHRTRVLFRTPDGTHRRVALPDQLPVLRGIEELGADPRVASVGAAVLGR